MAWSDRALDGAVLAATLHEDRAATEASRGLVPPVAAAVEARLVALEEQSSSERRAEIRRIAASLRPAPDPKAPLSPRARALLAGDVPRALGSRWIEGAPPPRRGFIASPALKAALRRLARATAEAGSGEASGRAERELRELREAGCLG